MGFFTRVKKSIFKFEEYEKFIEEPKKRAFIYFFKLMTIFSVFITIALAYTVNININKLQIELESKIPSFKIQEGILDIEETDTFEYYFEDYGIYLLMDENLDIYTGDSKENCIIMLKDNMVIKVNGYTKNVGYKDIQNLSNQTVIGFFETKEWKTLFLNICLIMLLLNFVVYSLIILLDVITLSILGLIINTLIKTTFKYKDLVKISIYAMTLPILLYLVYITANTLFGTTIKLFQLAYSAISYIYLITVMLMLKADIIKNMQELQTVLEEQKKVKEEIERQKEEEKQKQREKEKDEEKKQRQKEKGENSQEPQTDNG